MASTASQALGERSLGQRLATAGWAHWGRTGSKAPMAFPSRVFCSLTLAGAFTQDDRVPWAKHPLALVARFSLAQAAVSMETVRGVAVGANIDGLAVTEIHGRWATCLQSKVGT